MKEHWERLQRILLAVSSDWLEEDTLGVSGATCFRGLHRPPAAPQRPALTAAGYQDQILTSLLRTDTDPAGQMWLERVTSD